MDTRISVTENIPNIHDLKHPWLFYVLVFGLSLFVIGFVVDTLGRPTWAGFLAIYSVISVIASLFGYALVLLFEIAAKWQS